MKKWILSLFVISISLVHSSSFGDERILNFDSHIILKPDGSMEVTENIRVRAEGDKIKRGIFREIPTRYKTINRHRYVVDFQLLEIKKEGLPESYHIKHIKNGIAVYIGRENVFIPKGEYTYTIKYKTNRQLGFFQDHDELYWNATGNGWNFIIEKASATVVLPFAVSSSLIQLEGYTGAQGDKYKNYTSYVNNAGNIYFETTRPLSSEEGLTIVVGWPKGYILQPNLETRINYFLRDNWPVFIALFGMILLIIYFLVIWIKVGIDPRKGVIIPRYKPPDGYSPAAVRFITNMGYDNKTFALAVVNIAVKGYLTIEDKDGEYTLTKKRTDLEELSPGEQKIMTGLLGNKDSIILKNKNHTTIKKAITEFKNFLKLNYEKEYFLTNRKYFFPGLIYSILLIIICILLTARGEDLAILGFMSIWLTGWTIGTTALVFSVFSAWRETIKGKRSKIATGSGAMFLTLFSLPFIGGEIFGIFMVWRAIAGWVALFLLVLGFINYLFYHLLKAPTMTGRKLLDEIDGFKMYLTVAEKDRLNIIHPVTKTPDLFEKYLPYAMALDVEKEWAGQFADVFAKSAAGETEEYSPAWYHGAAWHTAGITGFAGSMGSSFSNSISSSTTAPGSSSGFSGGGGGGGSSGGGGGGGGGGGW